MNAESSPMALGDVLKARLKSNEPVLRHLPEVRCRVYPDSQRAHHSFFVPILGIRSSRFVLTRTPTGSYPSLEARGWSGQSGMLDRS